MSWRAWRATRSSARRRSAATACSTSATRIAQNTITAASIERSKPSPAAGAW
jgi:hypothetical protein